MNDQFSDEIWKKMQDHANQMLGDEFWKDIGSLLPHRFPRIDLYLAGSELILEAELPGLTSQKEVRVNIQPSYVILKGRIHRKAIVSDDQYFEHERTVGTFDREVRFPFSIDVKQVKARFYSGVLEIRMQRTGNEAHTPVDVQFEEDD